MAADLGKSLPNLKITVGNEDPPLVENILPARPAEINVGSTKQMAVQVVRKLMSSDEGLRVYENKGGAFITGLDLTSEVVTKKLIDRAARFGLENHPKNVISQVEIDNLYKSLEIHPEDGKTKNIRLDALHMRGVEDMSTQEVIDYFKEYGPSCVEWINDVSCNVVWLDDTGAARALLGLSRVLVLKKKSHSSPNDETAKNEGGVSESAISSEPAEKSMNEEVIFMSDLSSDDDEDEDDKLVGFKHENSGNPKDLASEAMDVEESSKTEENEQTVDNFGVDVPVPPGHWRLGIPHEKAKAILLRFASKDDRKLPGAEKRSQYYQKYGNPNYGGLKGLISMTRKRKMIATKQRHVVEQISNRRPTTNSEDSTRGSKRLRMRMHADDEEEKIKIKSANSSRSIERNLERRNVHDRLGRNDARYGIVRDVYDDNIHDDDDDDIRDDDDDIRDYGNRRDYDDNIRDYGNRRDYDDNIHDHNNIRDYDNAEEEGQVEDYDDGNDYEVGKKRSPMLKSAVLQPSKRQGKFNIWNRLAESMARESEFEEPNYQSHSSDRRERSDLRTRLHSSSHRPNPVKGDLRSKLVELRKHDNVAKHRSPLLMDVEREDRS